MYNFVPTDQIRLINYPLLSDAVRWKIFIIRIVVILKNGVVLN